MSDLVAVGDREVFVALLVGFKGRFDIVGNRSEAVGVSGFDVDLLNLGRASGFI